MECQRNKEKSINALPAFWVNSNLLFKNLRFNRYVRLCNDLTFHPTMMFEIVCSKQLSTLVAASVQILRECTYSNVLRCNFSLHKELFSIFNFFMEYFGILYFESKISFEQNACRIYFPGHLWTERKKRMSTFQIRRQDYDNVRHYPHQFLRRLSELSWNDRYFISSAFIENRKQTNIMFLAAYDCV